MTVDPDRWMKYPVPNPLPEALDGTEEWKTVGAIQERWKRLAIAAKPEKAPFTDLDAFVKEVEAALTPHVVLFRPHEVSLSNHRWLGSYFVKTQAEYMALEDRWVLSVPCKTGGRYYDVAPSKEAVEAVTRIAQRWGFEAPHWENNEKGWGSFVMNVTSAATLVTLLRSMEEGEAHDWTLPSGTKVTVDRTATVWKIKAPSVAVVRSYRDPRLAASILIGGGL